jgi:hypothetical protein
MGICPPNPRHPFIEMVRYRYQPFMETVMSNEAVAVLSPGSGYELCLRKKKLNKIPANLVMG